MATTKVSELSAKTSPSGSEELLINDGGTSKKITIANLPDTNTTYSVGDGGLTEINFTSADNTKLDGIEASADVTDATNVTAAGALMDSEVTNLAQVKAFDSSDYATAAQGTLATNALPKSGGAMTGAITTNSTFDGRDVATDGAKLDGIAASANNYVHPNHSGEVTSTADGATVIADNVVDEANLKISNTPTNGYVLTAQSGNTGGLTWAEISSGNTTANGMWEHAHTIASNYSITSGNNAIAAGPITINTGVSVTVPSGSTWVIA